MFMFMSFAAVHSNINRMSPLAKSVPSYHDLQSELLHLVLPGSMLGRTACAHMAAANGFRLMIYC